MLRARSELEGGAGLVDNLNSRGDLAPVVPSGHLGDDAVEQRDEAGYDPDEEAIVSAKRKFKRALAKLKARNSVKDFTGGKEGRCELSV